MGRRAKAGAADGRKAKSRRGASDEGGNVQRPGKLMLNNPLIPAEMDEDIDDDMAFDSEDEALYGQFFSGPTAESGAGHPRRKPGDGAKKRRGGRTMAEDDLASEQFAVIERTEKRRKKRRRGGDDGDEEDLYNYHEEGQTSDDDEHLDLSDMFDLAVKNQAPEASAKARKKSKATASASSALAGADDVAMLAGDAGQRHIVMKKRGARVTEESESLYGMADAGIDGGAGSFNSALRTIVNGKGGESNTDSGATQRLRDALARKHNLLSVDADDPTKDRVTRREVRAAVEQSLHKYKPLLRELKTAKHVQFPMRAPDSVPTPSTVGGIVVAAETRFNGDGTTVQGAAASSDAAGRLSTRVHALLSRAGLAKAQLQGGSGADDGAAPAAGSGTETIGDYVQFDEDDGTGGDGFGTDGDGDAPSRSYVAKLKAMLAYENSRRRRFNRIKSKTYRRILRKEKDRERERREKAFELLHPELARKRLAEKLLKARAEERVTQKHKNTSAWVKHAKRFTDFDANAKDAIDEQHAIHQRLMQRMEQEAGEENYERYVGADAESAMSSEEEHVVDELFASAVKPAAAGGSAKVTSILWQSVDDEARADAADVRAAAIQKARTELGGMKFMKAAREREERHYEEELLTMQDDIRRHQAGEELVTSDVDSGDEAGEHRGKKAAGRGCAAAAVGRRAFSPRAAPGTGDAPAAVEAIQLRKQSGLRAADYSSSDAEDGEENVHVSDVRSVGSGAPKDGDVMKDATEDAEGPGKGKTSARGKSAKAAAAAAARRAGEFAGLRDATIDAATRKKASKSTVSTRAVLKPGAGAVLRAAPAPVPLAVAPAEDATGEISADDLRAQQEYLISRAFAHDDVDEEFLKDKEAQVEAIMRPEDRNENLPGWGEWGGEDQRLNRRHQEKLSHSAMQKQIEKSFLMKSRADAALDHVIINHDGVELVPDRMTLHMVPRPFSNPKEFARSMRQPLGPEWSSATGFKDGVQPRVEVRQGHSVLPLDISLRGKKRSVTKRRKADVKK